MHHLTDRITHYCILNLVFQEYIAGFEIPRSYTAISCAALCLCHGASKIPMAVNSHALFMNLPKSKPDTFLNQVVN